MEIEIKQEKGNRDQQKWPGLVGLYVLVCFDDKSTGFFHVVISYGV